MVAGKFLKIDDVKLTKALQKAKGDAYLALIALNAFNASQLGEGPESLSKAVKSQGPNWRSLNSKYKERKEAKGHSGMIWVRTGNFLRAISQTKKKIGVEKGIKLKWNKSKKTAYLDVSGALGNNGQKRNASEKKDAFYNNHHRRKFMFWSDGDVRLATESAAKTLAYIFKKVGLGKNV